jgi:hypothetical protein
MKVTGRIQTVAMVVYSLPFLAVIVLSLFFVWAGNVEMLVTGFALLPVVLYFFGLRWCRYVVGVISVIGFVAASLRAIPALTMDPGRYFWLIWSPIWLAFAFSAFISFLPFHQADRARMLAQGPAADR